MGPDSALPLPAEFGSVDDYVESLLHFTTSSWLLQTLCGGVHILDFYTRSPDLYSSLLPQTWRTWFKDRDIMDVLDLLMREDLGQFDSSKEPSGNSAWRGGPVPPEDLLRYIREVKKHLLGRECPPPDPGPAHQKSSIARHIAVGMKVKKVHEVDNFARYVDRLTSEITAAGKKEITHLVDFGSGQNYLGRALAAPPYSKHLVAVESKQHNIEGAKNMDIRARLVPKPLVMRNKKEFRAGVKKEKNDQHSNGTTEPKSAVSKPGDEVDCNEDGCAFPTQPQSEHSGEEPRNGTKSESTERIPTAKSISTIETGSEPQEPKATVTTTLQIFTEGHGSVQYIEHIIKDGDLKPVIDQVLDPSQIREDNVVSASKIVEEATDLDSVPKRADVNAMVISLHSCGNLVHHGLRSLLLNPSVSAVAMVGCCYNLVTERLGPPTYKLPTLRPSHPRLVKTSNAFDPHGFPMSEKLANYPLPHTPVTSPNSDNNPTDPAKGIRLNITARMMGVQAPFNWGRGDSELFFTRHFYRALLQRIFFDRGVVSAPQGVDNNGVKGNGVPASGHTSKVNWTPPYGRGPGLSSDGTATPLTIGTLRKFAYNDFVSYVRAAISKLTAPNTFCEVDPEFIKQKLAGLTDEEIQDYEARYAARKKELSVMWSLMAFSAGVVEAVIVTDRWLWLEEQEEVVHAWVEPVFDYAMSPRNLVVVGVKK
ncbi:methyltransferase domain-containing protein [Massariosphaeria phaeospora]|uniref:Methyltransferase domain-containing protein n=1 Tax=Massariosphaeria phaeospora TaxID=100035 RepID=A0A7C8I6L5_9PLEO|nr:methyltransferase domain-containing protein [Massariosphaeria phaeospora]